MRILLDTNVWLDNYIPERDRYKIAGNLISTALSQGHDLLYPVGSTKDVFYLIGAAYKREACQDGSLSQETARSIELIAWACLDNMNEMATAIGADMSDVWLAGKFRSIHGDFEDDLVLAAAQRAHVDYLVTSDEELIKHATCAALTPEDMLKVLKVSRGED